MHLIVFPLSFVMPSIFEVKCTMTILLVIAFITLVPSSIRNVLFNKLHFDILTVLVVKMRQMREPWTTCEAFALPWAREAWNEWRTDYRAAVSSTVNSCCRPCERNTWCCKAAWERIWACERTRLDGRRRKSIIDRLRARERIRGRLLKLFPKVSAGRLFLALSMANILSELHWLERRQLRFISGSTHWLIGKMPKISNSDNSLVISIIQWRQWSVVLANHWFFLLSIHCFILEAIFGAHQYAVDLGNIMAE